MYIHSVKCLAHIKCYNDCTYWWLLLAKACCNPWWLLLFFSKYNRDYGTKHFLLFSSLSANVERSEVGLYEVPWLLFLFWNGCEVSHHTICGIMLVLRASVYSCVLPRSQFFWSLISSGHVDFAVFDDLLD